MSYSNYFALHTFFVDLLSIFPTTGYIVHLFHEENVSAHGRHISRHASLINTSLAEAYDANPEIKPQYLIRIIRAADFISCGQNFTTFDNNLRFQFVLLNVWRKFSDNYSNSDVKNTCLFWFFIFQVHFQFKFSCLTMVCLFRSIILFLAILKEREKRFPLFVHLILCQMIWWNYHFYIGTWVIHWTE